MKLNPAELQPIWNQVQGYLTNFAADPAFSTKMQQAFGPGNFDALQMAWAQGNLGVLPAVEVRPATDINGANGAFAGATNTIYLSQEFYDQNEVGGNDRPIAEVVLEEYGHYLDGQIDSLDSPGDEGDIFARLARGQLLTQPELSALQAEDDTVVVVLDGQDVAIEQNTRTVNETLDFSASNIEGWNNFRLPRFERTIFETGPIESSGQVDNFGFKFDWNLDTSAGIKVFTEWGGLGRLTEFRYPISVNLEQPRQVSNNEGFSINTSSFTAQNGVIRGSGFELPGAGINLEYSLGSSGLSNISFESIFGTASIPDIGYFGSPIQNEKELVRFRLGDLGLNFPIGELGSVSLTPPDNININTSSLPPDATSFIPASTDDRLQPISGTGTDDLARVALDIDAIIAFFFPPARFVKFPPVRFGGTATDLVDDITVDLSPDQLEAIENFDFDKLTREDIDRFAQQGITFQDLQLLRDLQIQRLPFDPTAELNKSRFNFNASLDLLDITANFSHVLRQDFIFAPTNVNVTMSVVDDSSQTQTGNLGDSFEFTAPDEGSGILEIEAEYEISGRLFNEIGWALQGSLNADVLKYQLGVKIGPLSIPPIQGGPLLKGQFPEGGLTSEPIPIAGSNPLASLSIAPIDITTIDGDEDVTKNLVVEKTYYIPYGLQVSIADASTTEGDSGTKDLEFAVTLSEASSDPVTVNYSSPKGSGSVTFAPGETSNTINIPVRGDTIDEPNETFTVTLNSSSDISFPNTLPNGEPTISATGTIIDDDTPPDEPDGGEGDSHNDPRMVSFDGLYYDFQAVGEFILVESASEDLIIQVRQEPINERNQSVSINTAVATVVDGQRVGLYFDREQQLLIDGTPTDIPSSDSLILGDGRIFRQGNIYTIVYPTGDQLVAKVLSSRIDIKTFLAEGREGEVAGILGNNNGDRFDDISLRDGTVLSQPVSDRQLYTEYANSWRITQAESLFDYEPGENTNTFTNLNFPVGTISIDDLDPVARQAAEALADAAGLTDPILRESAIIDIVLTRADDGTFDQSIIESALESQIPEEALIIDFPPRAFDDFDSTIVNTSVSIDVLANDIPSPDGPPLVIDRFDRTSREGGSISLDDSGTPDDPTDDQLVFTPPADFSGFDLFKYTVSDGINTDTARVTVTVPQLNLSDIDGSNGFVLNGINIDDFSGSSVSEIGDINNDGIDDLIVGAPLADSNGNDNVGSSYVVFGSISGFPESFDLSQINGSNGFVINGIDVDNFSGISVSGVGDINDDGIDDLIVGAFGTAPNGDNNAGSSYVIFGSNEAFPASFDLSELNGSNGFVIDGNNEFNHSGIVVSEAGDLNADGINDLLVNAPGPADEGFGQSYAVFGRSEGFPARINPFGINGNNGFLLNDTDGNSGGDISSAGDINGDGIDDLILGADVTVVPPEPTAEEPTEGEPTEEEPIEEEPVEAYVVFGTPGIFPPNLDLSNLDGSNGFVLDDGIEGANDSGTFVSGIGDINGDGLDDIAVADPNSNGSAGRVYVVFGSEEEFAASFDLFSLNGSNGFILNGIEAGDYAGISVSDAGDVNGDGFDDLIIGASDADIINEEETDNGEETDGENQNVGRSFLIFGKEEFDATLNLSQLNGRNGLIINGVDPDERSGLAVSGAGDLNGDGIDDLAIGSPGSFFTESAGKTYILFGSEDFGKQNNPPETASDRATTARNTEVSIDVLANDRDIDDDILRVLNFTAPSNGSLGLDNNGTFRDISDDRLIYSPNPGFIGRDSFEYRIDDGNGGTETGTVEVTVTSEIGAPPKPTLTVIRGTSSDDSLTGTEENNVILGFQGNDFLNGLSGDDVLFAGEGADTLTGGIGNDILYGDNGNDLLNGGPGDDTLTGGSGRDILQGGVGSDVFVLSTSTAVPGRVEADVIPFFEVGVDAIGLIVGVIEEDLTLEARGTNTIVKLGESDEILGIVSKVTPEELEGSFVPVNIDLF